MTILGPKISAVFNEIWMEQKTGEPPVLTPDTVLLDAGLDSLGYAILVARLDEELGFDPFTQATEAFYPETFGQFVAFYEAHAPRP